MYTDRNFKSKKELKAAVEAYNAWQKGDRTAFGGFNPGPVTYHQAGPFGGNEPQNGTVGVEGPHYPQPHKWYAECTVENGIIVKVK